MLQAIRGSGSKTPVIMVTTKAETSRIKVAITGGVTNDLAKPFENDVLKQKFQKDVCATP